MDNSSNPNPHDPNIIRDHQVPHSEHQLNDSPYFDIVNFLMTDGDEGSEENIQKNEDIAYDPQNVTTNFSGGSSSSASFASKTKCRRELKKYKEQEEYRFAFRTKTDLEIMDDGYKWRKYGKKMVKNNPNPRNYFKCSSGGCGVKKRVERDREDSSYVITTYQGMHNHETPNCVPYYSPQPPPSSLLHTSSSI